MSDRMLRVDVVLGSRSVAAAVAAALMLGTASELASESLTMTITYPAPSATYGNLMTTGQTSLARDSGGVTVGTTGTGSAKLAVMNGSVGIGTTNPTYDLDIEGRQTFGDVTVNQVHGLSWHYQSAWGNGGLNYGIGREPGVWGTATALDAWGYPNLAIDFHTGVRLKSHSGYGGVQIWENWCDSGVTNCASAGSGTGSAISQFRANPWGGTYIASKFGAGNTAPAAALDVGGEGIAIFRQQGGACRQKDYSINSGASCYAGEYITQQSGVLSRYAAGTAGGAGSALCCRCPQAGGGAPACPSLP